MIFILTFSADFCILNRRAATHYLDSTKNFWRMLKSKSLFFLNTIMTLPIFIQVKPADFALSVENHSLK